MRFEFKYRSTESINISSRNDKTFNKTFGLSCILFYLV